MEVYTLDPLFRRAEVIDQFESLIWTERYNAFGDFELDIYSTLATRNLFKAGTHLAINESHRVMEVEIVLDGESDGKEMLKVTGRSIEKILDDRIAKDTLSNLTTEPKWVITDKPADIARKIFHDICVLGNLDPGDVIPFINEGSFLDDDTIPEPVDPITVELDPMTVYAAVKDICDVWNLGFCLIRNFDASQLYFDIYTGNDRTSAQTVLPPVIFTPELDNLQNTSELNNITDAKNVAYVFSPAGYQVVVAPEVDPEVEGFERRILVVNATDITTDNPDVESALIRRGSDELAKSRAIQAFDGEISQYSQFKYNRDYQLGDIVEMRSKDGVTNNMRVTEQIFVSDSEGDRSYPTLTLNSFINTGSWLSWLNNSFWVDMGLTEYWNTQP